MNFDTFLVALSEGGARILFDGGKPKIFARAEFHTDEIRQAFEEHRVTLASLLQDRSTRPSIILDKTIEDDQAAFPLTDIQSAYLLGQNGEFELGGVPTNYYAEFEIYAFNVERLVSVWDTLVSVHPMLHAVIQDDGFQKIVDEPPSKTTCKIWDVSDASGAALTAHFAAIRNRLAHPEQSLGAEGRAFSFEYSHLSEDKGILHVRMDYMLVDFASGVLLLGELSRALVDSEWAPSLPAASFQSVCARRAAATQGPTYEAARNYWLERVAGFAAAPELPRSSQEMIRPRFCNRRFELSRAEWDEFRSYAFASGLTPTAALLQAFADVLSQWTAQTRFALNVTSFGRMDSKENSVVGDFTEVLLLEVDVTLGRNFEERARATQRQLRSDMDHLLYNGVRVLRDLARQSGEVTRALMPFVFTCGIGIQTSGRSEKLAFGAPAYSLSQAPQILLDHQIFEHDGGVVIVWDAVDEAFPAGLLDTMFSTYRSLIEKLSAEQNRWVESWPGWYAGHLEARRRYNNTKSLYAPEPLHLGFLRNVRRAPDKPAIFDDDLVLSYGALAAFAAHGCRKLISAGFEGGPVGIVMKKGWRQVAAVLAILFAGGTYVPIDINWPKARRDEILKDTTSKFAFVDSEGLESDLPIDMIYVDENQDVVPDNFPGNAVSCSESAYIIFTSGSTGKPKGVTVSHAAAGNTCDDLVRRYALGPDDRVFAISSLNFDLSVFDIFGLLSAGGSLVFPPPSQQPDPVAWGEVATSNGVTIWNSVPALMQLYAASCKRGDAPQCDLRLIMLSGDWIPVPLVPVVQQLWPEAAFKSLGGATEAAIWSIKYPITDFDPAWASVPYGFPLRNQTIHVLDMFLRPCPDLVTGEIYIGGDGLALGYWGDEKRTAERFFPHPETGERLYRTGDLGRFCPNGAVEFLGRADNQMKISGYRIEAGEIEHALRSHPLIENALVSVRKDSAGTPSLVAHYTVAAAAAASSDHPILERWSDVFDKTYDEAATAPEFNTAGWTDSFSGSAIAESDMAEWLSETLTAIEPFIRGKVLEIGVGTGMLARQIAPRADRFVGIDISAVAVENLNNVMSSVLDDSRVRIEQMSAGRICDLNEDNFDLIIINSVVQYFPSSAFLKNVISNSASILKSDGVIFIGDVRNIDWHRHFLMRLAKEDHTLSMDDAIERLRSREPELLANPTWFAVVANDLPVRFSSSCALKAGLADTEMNRYRFDIILSGPDAVSTDNGKLQAATFAAADWEAAIEYARTGRAAIVEGLNSAWVRDECTSETHKAGELIAAARSAGCVAQAWLDGTTNDSFTLALNCAAPPYADGDLAARAEGPQDRVGFGPMPGDLQKHLAQQLPTYMIPSAFVAVEAFPLTANGKVDLAALPEPGLGSIVTSAEYAPPQGPLEIALAELWKETLGVDRIGRDDDFFRLGGNSLMAAGMLDRAEELLGKRIDLGSLLRSPTIANIALRAEGAIEVSNVVALSGDGSPKLAAIIHPIGGDVFCYTALASIFPSDFAVFGVRSPSLHDSDFRASTVDQLAENYLNEIESRTGRCPDVVGGWSFGGIVALEIARKIRSAGKMVKLISIDALLPDGKLQALPDENELIASALRDLGGLQAQALNDGAMHKWAARLAGHPPLSEVRAVLAEAGMLAPGMSDDAIKRLLQTYNINAEALFCYTPDHVDAQTLVVAAQRGEVDESGITAWQTYCPDSRVLAVDCDHYEIVRPPALELVRSGLEAFLRAER